jgi:hypothetical protein
MTVVQLATKKSGATTKANCLSYLQYKVKTIGAEVAPCFLQPFELFHNGNLIQHLAFKEILNFKLFSLHAALKIDELATAFNKYFIQLALFFLTQVKLL